MEKNRVEAFSDGVLAIIITIMVLELKQPVSENLKDLFKLAPTFIAYLLSFVFIAIYWINHHQIFHDAKQINVKILWCNIAWMFTMSFIPFATAWVGTYPTSWAPLSLYCADMLLARITFQLMCYLIFKESHEGENFNLGLRSIISLATYFLATVLGGFCPIAAYIAVAVVSAWWIIPIKKNKSFKMLCYKLIFIKLNNIY